MSTSSPLDFTDAENQPPPPTQSLQQSPGGAATLQPPGGATKLVQSPGGATKLLQSPGGATKLLQSPGGATKLLLSPGGASYRSPLKSPLATRSILKPSTRDNVGQSPAQKVKFQSSAPTVVTPTRYDDIRDLDIAEDWKESVTVVTKQDHEVYTRLCGTIVDDLVDTLPLTDTNAAEKDVTPDLIPETISAQLNSTYTSEPTDSLDAPVTDSTVTEPAQQLPEPTLIPSEPTSFPTEPTSIPSEPEITVTEPDQPQDAEALLDLIPVKEPKPDSADPVTSGPETVLPETVAPELVPEPKASPVEEAASETAPPEAAPAVEKLIEPTAIQASAAEPVVTEPVVTEPATEPVITEPAAEPVTTESVTAEPEVREPRAAEPVLADPVAAEPEAPEPVLPAAPSETIEEQPLPKGSYTFNWDDIDEFSDPFAPKASKIPTSPKVPTKVATSPKPVDNKPEVKAPSPVKTVAEVSPQVPESVPEPLVPLEGAVGGLRHLDKLREADIANVSLDAENFPEADEPPEDDKLPELTEAELIAPLEAEQSAALEAQLSAARLETSIHEAETSLDAEELPAPATVAEDLPITPQDAPLNKAKMSAGEEEIPISKGAYNIDWDNFDDNINPFATKSKVVNEDQPLNASSNAQVDFEDPNFDPFKPKAAMANSPTLSRKPGTPSTVTKSKPKTAAAKKTSPQPSPAKPAQEPADINQNVEVKSPPSEVLDNAATDNCEPREGGPHDLNQRDLQDTDRQSPKKKQPGSATKKAPRRFKPPARFAKKQGDEDEIQILAGPPPPRVTEPASEPAPELSQPEPSPKAPSQPSPEAPSPAAEPSQPAATQPPAASEPPTQQPPVTADPPREAREAPPLSHSSPDAVRGDLPTIPQEFDVADEEFAASDPNMFNDPAAWDMLEKFGTGNNADFKESALARQSLYVKFDPLVKGQSPVKALRKPSGETIAESEDSLLLMGTPPPTKGRGGPRHPASRALEAQILARDPPTRPDSLGHTPPHTPGEEGRAAEVDRLFACSPATAELMSMMGSNEMTTSREQTIKPLMTSSWLDTIKDYNELEGDSAVYSQDSVECLNMYTQDTGRPESPLQFDHEEVLRIDSSLEASGRQNGTSPVNQRDGLTQSTDSLDIVHVLKYSQADLNRIKKELDLDYQARFLAKERDWEKERDALDKSHGKRDQELKELRKQNVDMKSVVSEYEQTMTQLIAEKESYTSLSKESLADLVKERDQALEDLHSVETAFSDLHRRFEKSKAALEGFKKNEETFKKALSDQQTKIKKQDDKYQALKKHAEEKLEQANTETERIRKATQADLTRLQAGMKRADLQIQSLEQQIEQKVKENKELTSICDELINKVEH